MPGLNNDLFYALVPDSFVKGAAGNGYLIKLAEEGEDPTPQPAIATRMWNAVKRLFNWGRSLYGGVRDNVQKNPNIGAQPTSPNVGAQSSPQNVQPSIISPIVSLGISREPLSVSHNPVQIRPDYIIQNLYDALPKDKKGIKRFLQQYLFNEQILNVKDEITKQHIEEFLDPAAEQLAYLKNISTKYDQGKLGVNKTVANNTILNLFGYYASLVFPEQHEAFIEMMRKGVVYAPTSLIEFLQSRLNKSIYPQGPLYGARAIDLINLLYNKLPETSQGIYRFLSNYLYEFGIPAGTREKQRLAYVAKAIESFKNVNTDINALSPGLRYDLYRVLSQFLHEYTILAIQSYYEKGQAQKILTEYHKLNNQRPDLFGFVAVPASLLKFLGFRIPASKPETNRRVTQAPVSTPPGQAPIIVAPGAPIPGPVPGEAAEQKVEVGKEPAEAEKPKVEAEKVQAGPAVEAGKEPNLPQPKDIVPEHRVEADRVEAPKPIIVAPGVEPPKLPEKTPEIEAQKAKEETRPPELLIEGRELTANERQQMQDYLNNVIRKGARVFFTSVSKLTDENAINQFLDKALETLQIKRIFEVNRKEAAETGQPPQATEAGQQQAEGAAVPREQETAERGRARIPVDRLVIMHLGRVEPQNSTPDHQEALNSKTKSFFMFHIKPIKGTNGVVERLELGNQIELATERLPNDSNRAMEAGARALLAQFAGYHNNEEKKEEFVERLARELQARGYTFAGGRTARDLAQEFWDNHIAPRAAEARMHWDRIRTEREGRGGRVR